MHHIQEHCEPQLMSLIDKRFQLFGRAYKVSY